MDAQQEHDQAMTIPTKASLKGSRKRLEALLNRKNADSSKTEQFTGLGPIARAMKRNPTLTRQEAEQMAREHGF